MDHFLKRMKRALEVFGRIPDTKKDCREAYLNLFSFAHELKEYTAHEIANKYLELAQKVSNVKELTREEFAGVLSQLLDMSDNIKDYLLKKENFVEKRNPF